MEYQVYGLPQPQEYFDYCESHIDALEKVLHPNPAYADSLGWYRVEEWASESHRKRIKELAQMIREKADVFVLIGVGGSNNAARSVIKAIQEDRTIEVVYAGHTLHPYALKKMLESLEGKEVYIDCIAKNFATLEPGSSFRILRNYLKERYGDNAKNHILATGTKESNLEVLCQKHGYEFLEFPLNIGGRFSALSNVGLLPMAVAGIDIDSLVQGAKEMAERLQESSTKNIAYQYACMRNYMYEKGYQVEMLSSFEPQLHYFNQWWTQLFGESEGKNNKGLFPVTGEFSEQLHSIGQYIQEGSNLLFETFLKVKEKSVTLYPLEDEVEDEFGYLNDKDFYEINQAAYLATLQAHSNRFACGEITVDKLNAYTFGQLFYFFEFACYVSCELLQVNPFDQPGVEDYKTRMFHALGKE